MTSDVLPGITRVLATPNFLDERPIPRRQMSGLRSLPEPEGLPRPLPRYFLAYTWRDEDDKIGANFRASNNRIGVAFRHEDWQAIESLFRRRGRYRGSCGSGTR